LKSLEVSQEVLGGGGRRSQEALGKWYNIGLSPFSLFLLV